MALLAMALLIMALLTMAPRAMYDPACLLGTHSPAEDGTRQYCLERQSTHYDSTCYGHDHICLVPGTHRGPGGAHVPPRSVGDAEGRLRRDGGPQGELKL